MPRPNQDRPVVDAAKVIVSAAIVAALIALVIVAAIVQGATSSIGAFLVLCAGIAYAVRRNKRKQVAFAAERAACMVEQQRAPIEALSHGARMARFAELGRDEYDRQRRTELHLPPD
ncbi:MAG: hypothetical protein WAU42_14650 [Solirubrobacteraceae bacterium]